MILAVTYRLSFSIFQTNRLFSSFRQEVNFSNEKALKWWLQSYLIGIEIVVVGLRDDEGHVRDIRQLRVKDIPKLKAEQIRWKPNVCLNFLGDLLTFIRQRITVSSFSDVYRLEWSPGQSSVKCCQISADIEGFDFLPRWFLDELTE